MIHNECFANTADPDYIRKITNAHKAGVNAVVIHCAMHTYRAAKIDDWREFLGVTSRRHEDKTVISIDEILEANASGRLQEAFGTGTAAVISPVGELFYKDQSYVINSGQTGALSKRLFDELQAIQKGHQEDPFKWVVRVA